MGNQAMAEALATVLNLIDETNNEIEIWLWDGDHPVIRINCARGEKPIDIMHKAGRWQTG